MEITISVVIPTYNRKDMVKRAISSVLGQSYGVLEVIVIDDGSTDGTEDALEAFTRDARFRYRRQENRGQSAARNAGIAMAVGDVIAFLDSDNFWHEEKLERQLAFWDHNSFFDILYSDVVPVDLSGRPLVPELPVTLRPSGNILKTLITCNCVTNNTVLVPKRCFREMGGFDEELRVAEDFELWLRFATRYSFGFHPEKVSYYCVEGERLSAQQELTIDANVNIMKDFVKKYPGVVSARDLRKALSRLSTWRTEVRWNDGVRPTFKQILHGVCHGLDDARAWRHLIKFILQ